MAELRREAGLWLRRLRESRGFSQRALAEQVGLEYYTFVSQIEAGRGRIPAERYQLWADALKIEPAVFVRNMLRFYEPSTFRILFGDMVIETTDGPEAPPATDTVHVIPFQR